MSTRVEIEQLEERLRQAELGPDPAFFEEVLADEVVLVDEQGRPALAKAKVVEAHRPGGPAKFTRVEMREREIVDHGAAAVVTCVGTFEGPRGSVTLRFMRVWLKRGGRWQIVAGSVSSGTAAR
jgi:hypothetical protein